MSKRDPSTTKLISINIFNSSDESIMSVAILNAITLLQDEHPEADVVVPARKELTKLLKNADFDNFCRVFDEINHICIRPVPCLEAVGNVGIVPINHPILGMRYCLAYRDKTINEYEYKLVNSGLGQDEVVVDVTQQFNDKLEWKNENCYQIFFKQGEKQIVQHEEYSCNECCHYAISKGKDFCLYDNQKLTTTNQCCNQYFDCFKWNTIEKENV